MQKFGGWQVLKVALWTPVAVCSRSKGPPTSVQNMAAFRGSDRVLGSPVRGSLRQDVDMMRNCMLKSDLPVLQCLCKAFVPKIVPCMVARSPLLRRPLRPLSPPLKTIALSPTGGFGVWGSFGAPAEGADVSPFTASRNGLNKFIPVRSGVTSPSLSTYEVPW